MNTTQVINEPLCSVEPRFASVPECLVRKRKFRESMNDQLVLQLRIKYRSMPARFTALTESLRAHRLLFVNDGKGLSFPTRRVTNDRLGKSNAGITVRTTIVVVAVVRGREMLGLKQKDKKPSPQLSRTPYSIVAANHGPLRSRIRHLAAFRGMEHRP